jgi:hypothetical protein
MRRYIGVSALLTVNKLTVNYWRGIKRAKKTAAD